MVDALEAYFAAGHELAASNDNWTSDVAPLTVDTAAIQRQFGFKAREIAATYVTIVHGALVNFVPTLFWCVAYVFSRSTLVAQLREELITAFTFEGEDQNSVIVDADRIEFCCPLLLSVLRETQRLVAIGTLHRRVVEDTVVTEDRSDGDKTELKRSYLLKKGTSILMPVAINHRNPLIWGPTANEFNAARFLESPHLHEAGHNRPLSETWGAADESTSTRLRRMAYFPFGGGKELCPGRNFATTELLSTMAVLVLGYDIQAAGGGPLKEPAFGPPKMTAATARPHADAHLNVRVGRREGWEQVVWRVKT